jgi:hypothetical protein
MLIIWTDARSSAGGFRLGPVGDAVGCHVELTHSEFSAAPKLAYGRSVAEDPPPPATGPRAPSNPIGSSMAEAEFPKRLQLPRILERRRAPADFQFGATDEETGNEIETSDSPANEAYMRRHRGGETNTDATFGLRKIRRRPQKPVDEIATLIQGLTYGEMIELSEVMWTNRPNGLAVTLENLPELFHRWSTSRAAAAYNGAPCERHLAKGRRKSSEILTGSTWAGADRPGRVPEAGP